MNETENILGMQDLLERSWQEIQKRFLPFFLLAACAPLATWFIQGIFMGFDPLKNTEPSVWISLISSLLISLVSVWFNISLILFICKHTRTITESWIFALHRLPRFIIGVLLYMLCLGAGTALAFGICFLIFYLLSNVAVIAWLLIILWVCFFAMVFFAVAIYWIFIPYLFILTDFSLTTCFTLSYRLVKGHFWHTVALLFILLLIAAGISILSALAIGTIGIIGTVLLPASRYLIVLLGIIPAALLALIYQVPLLALYLDLSPNTEVQN